MKRSGIVVLRSSNIVVRCSMIVFLSSVGALAGCYSPNTASGAYLCDATGTCPTGQHCICGQCVNSDTEAACAFAVTVAPPACTDWPPAESNPPKNCVHEHQPFPVTVTALQADKKTPATGFHAAVEVSSSWGDATLVSGGPGAFSNGTGTLMVSLDRETVGVAGGARIIVRAGTASGAATTRVLVSAPRWKLDAQAALLPGAWADLYVTQPDVLRLGDGYRMYFTGAGGKTPATYVEGIGVATSSDGKSWTLQPQPIARAGFQQWNKNNVDSPTAFVASTGEVRLLFKGSQSGLPFDNPDAVLGLATSTDGLAFSLPTMPVLTQKACVFCSTGLTLPSAVPFSDVLPGGVQLYFSSSKKANGVGADTPQIGHAISSDDGATWDVDPFPVVSVNSEELAFSPHVFLEGTVYKMFFALASKVPPMPDINSLCNGAVQLNIAYATSSDGLYWIRSLSNPIITSPVPAVAGPVSLLPGKVLPNDPANPDKGLTLWYSVFQTVQTPFGNLCAPSGVYRATRD